MNDSTTLHPLVVDYLDDLRRLLDGIEPVERAEVIDGIREHLDEALPDGASEDDVRAALGELGSPETVAEEAYTGRPRVAPRAAAGPWAQATSRSWLPILAAVLHSAAGLLLMAVVSTLVTVSEGGSTDSAGRQTVTETHFGGAWSGAVGAFVVAAPVWLLVVVLVAICGLWTAREKAALIALFPTVAFTTGLLPTLGYAALGINGVYVGGWTALALFLFGGGGVLVVLTRRALRRSAELNAHLVGR